MKNLKIGNSLVLLLAACIWGVAFVAQSVAMDYVGPFTFSCVRFLLGGIVLLPVIAVLSRTGSAQKKEPPTGSFWQRNKNLITAGILCGTALCIANNFQQVGIMTTSAGKAGFITAFYIIFVPVVSLLLGRKSRITIWLSVLIAIIGLYLLCVKEGFSITQGDLLILVCAIVFSFHILIVDHYSPLVDGVKLSCIQFFVAGTLSAIPMLLFEHPALSQILEAKTSIMYAGIMSCGVAYTLQIVGQKNMNPTIASLILSMESVISVIAGWLILNQALTYREIGGCALMFAAIILAQLPSRSETAK